MTDEPTPRTDGLIAEVMRRFPGASISSDARYYEAVHQELAPLARALERELADRDTVPRSRYDACNRDWLEAEAELARVRQVAVDEIERLRSEISAALARCDALTDWRGAIHFLFSLGYIWSDGRWMKPGTAQATPTAKTDIGTGDA